MDYEKKYKEALEWARKVIQGKVGFVLDEVLEKFPELKENKESEDERIRRAIIHFISHTPTVPKGIIGKEIMITWLKKQGKQNMIPLDKVIKFLDEQLVNDKDEVTGEPFINFQNYGAYKETFISYFKRKMIEKQGEQKPTDKVEPKFNEGDWVVFSNRPEKGCIYQVEKIENHEYILRHFLGDLVPFSFSHENMIRLWTVDDAHEGDVLAYDDGSLTIFGHRLRGIDSGLYMAHVLLTYNIEFKQTCATANVHPATKEQRDILFAKLKEAGYEWDNKKKEPKKIEQKPAEWGGNEGEQKQNASIQINPSEYINDMEGNGCCLKNTVQSSTWTKEDKKMLSDIVDCLKNLPIFYASLNINGEDKTAERFICDALNWLRSIEGRVQQKKQGWSEEDKEQLGRTIYMMEQLDMTKSWGDVYSWLKSIENRVLPHTRQEWSEEDEKILDRVITNYESGYLPSVEKRDEIIKKLKSLRPQINVTDEELSQAKKDAYNDVLDKLEYDSENPTFDDGWSAAIWYLKKRNAQFNNTWKPSDEQLTWLYRAADDASKDSRMKQILNELLSDLKKLRGE